MAEELTIMFAKPGEVEVTALLVRRADGWRIQFEFEDGMIAEQDNPPFATQADAQAALDTYCKQTGIRRFAVN